MSNFRIVARNLANAAEGGFLTSSTSMVPGLPFTNLQRPVERARTCRTNAGATNVDLTASWATNKRANCAIFGIHNWTTASLLRTRLFDATSPASDLIDTGDLSAFSTSGLATNIDVYTERDFRFLKTTAQYFALQTTMRSAYFYITDTANPDGYIEQTRLCIGEYFETSYDPPFGGAVLTPMDAGVSGRADDGTMLVDKKWKARKLELDLKFIPEADLDDLLAIVRFLGTDKECFISLYPGVGGVKELYNQMFCRLKPNPSFDPWTDAGLHQTKLVFEEV